MDLDINLYQYEQYNSIWCKVIPYQNLPTDTAIIEHCIEEISMYHSPESWCGHFKLLKDHWQPSTSEHHLLAHEMIEACWFYQNNEIQEARHDRDKYLSYFGFEGGIEALKELSEEKQQEAQEILQKRWYKYSAINEKDELKHIVFNHHHELQDKFLHQLFSPDARFYINKTIEETKVCLYDRKRHSPAIIGIDEEKVAMFWFNF